MTLFEFVTVMISMILALSLGHLLETMSYLVRVRTRVRWDLAHCLWVIALAPTLINHWWALWDMRELAWNYAAFLYMLIAPISLSLAASFVMPDRRERGTIDLAAHFGATRRIIAILLFVYGLAMWFDGPIFAGQRVFGLIGLLHIPILIAFLLTFFGKGRITLVAAPCIMIIMLAAIMMIRLYTATA